MAFRPFGFIPFLIPLLLTTVGCQPKPIVIPEKLTVGVVSYGDGAVSVDKYQRFKDYIADQTDSVVELEPTYNELQAIAQIQQQRWDLVFAPPGLVAIALSNDLYIPLFPLSSISSTERTLIVVRDESPIQRLGDLANKVMALGEKGSAAGYYLPLYDLYGLTLAEIRFASTPKITLEWLSQGKIDAGALAEKDFQRYQKDFSSTRFRILHTGRSLPTGAVLLGPNVDRNRQEQIRKAMADAPPDIAADAGYLPSSKPIDYKDLVALIKKVRPIETRVRQKPAVLTIEPAAAAGASPSP